MWSIKILFAIKIILKNETVEIIEFYYDIKRRVSLV